MPTGGSGVTVPVHPDDGMAEMWRDCDKLLASASRAPCGTRRIAISEPSTRGDWIEPVFTQRFGRENEIFVYVRADFFVIVGCETAKPEGTFWLERSSWIGLILRILMPAINTVES